MQGCIRSESSPEEDDIVFFVGETVGDLTAQINEKLFNNQSTIRLRFGGVEADPKDKLATKIKNQVF